MTTEFQKDINQLQRDSVQMATVIGRMDVAVERLTNLASDVSKILAVQESKLENHDRTITSIVLSIEKRRDEINAQLESLHKDMDNTKENITDSVSQSLRPVMEKVNGLEKFVWVLSGLGMAVGLLLGQMGNIIRALSVG